MTFVPKQPDFEKSPFTGMTWQHWVDAGVYLLDGVFAHLPSAESPLHFPRHETEVTYPRPGDPLWRQRSENFEAVARTLLIAAPLLKHFPDLTIRGIRLADYYRRQIALLADPASEQYACDSASVVALSGDNPYQMTCECASLAIALHTAPEALWEPLNATDKERILRLFSDWAHRRTHPHNWRLFNMLILAFLQAHGAEVDDAIYRDHAQVVRSFDAGDGWYRDGTLFDYYSVWAFQFYAPLWAHWAGYETWPEMAAAIEQSAQKLLETYDRLFDRRGRQLMWGRSNIYRFAACAPFGSAFLLKNNRLQPGVARRVMSGNLLQFLGHPDFRVNGLPSLGFYGPFKPLIQPYSCAASPFWFGNGYHAVALGPDHPLWTAVEEEGSWADVPATGATETELPGPGMVVTQYGGSGASEIRTGKVMMQPGKGWRVDYCRLAFHTDLPWQADTPEGIASMCYTLKAGATAWEPNLIFYSGRRNAVLYRRMVFNNQGAFGHCPMIDLADFVLPEGLVRCDRLRIPEADSTVTLAHYALPVLDGEVMVEERELAHGVTAQIAASGERQVALVTAHGWQGTRALRHAGLHPETAESVLLTASSDQPGLYGADPLRIAVMLHRNNRTPWIDEELWPFCDVTVRSVGKGGSVPEVEFILRDGTLRTVDYSCMERVLVL